METDTEVEDSENSENNNVPDTIEVPDDTEVSPGDKIEESNTQIPDTNQTVDIEDSTSDNGNSVLGISIFLICYFKYSENCNCKYNQQKKSD